MTKRVKEVLKVVEDVLLGFDQDSVDLWAILTALRGPDSQARRVKALFTVPIRRNVFPRLKKKMGAEAILANFQGDEELRPTQQASDEGIHFRLHIYSAQQAIQRRNSL